MSRQPLDFSLNLGIDNSRRNSVFDVWIVTSVFLLSLLGISMIYSASQSVEMALRQGIYMVFGFVVLTIISFSNFRKMEVFYLYSYWPGLFLLIIVLFFSNENNETLEFLGDAVINLSISDLIIKNFPNVDEGILSLMRSKLVSRDTLNKIGKEIKLNEFIICGESFKNQTLPENILGNALEAIFGAIYQEKGFETSKRIVVNLFAKKTALSSPTNILSLIHI